MLRQSATSRQEVKALVTGCAYFFSDYDVIERSGFQTQESPLCDTIRFRNRAEAALARLQYRKLGILATRKGKTLVISQ